MSNNDVKNQILSVLDDYTIGTLATIQDGNPYSRFMMFFMKILCSTPPPIKIPIKSKN
ncbi:general stress protein 26 [Priestia megaterium]|nr:general stress protein 26 [Priestia megaterium]SUV21689.1 general stress protein 26 [Priestia megaterium]